MLRSSVASNRSRSEPSRRQTRAVVRLSEIDRSPFRNDSGWVDLFDRPVVDDVITRLHGRGDARHQIKLAHIVQEIGIVGDAPLVAFEQREISDVETNKSRK